MFHSFFSRTCIAGLLVLALSADGECRAEPEVFHTLQRNSWYLPTDDGTASIFVTSLGQGPRVVVLHGGFGANYEYLVRAVERHTARREFILFDQRGSLLSPYRGKLEELSVDDLVEDLEKLRRELGENKLVIMAHSMGTWLAFEYLRRYVDRVGALILTGTFPPMVAADADDEKLWAPLNARSKAMTERPEVLALLTHEGVDGITDELSARDRTKRQRILFAGMELARIEKWRDMQGGWVYYRREIGQQVASTAKRYDVRTLLGSRRIPTTVIQGDQDFVDPAASSWTALQREAVPVASCVRVHVLERAGHVPWVDDPDAFQAAMNAAFARRPSTCARLDEKP